jgi:hypothetical protein
MIIFKRLRVKDAIIMLSRISCAQSEASGSFDMGQDPILTILPGDLPASSQVQKIILLYS